MRTLILSFIISLLLVGCDYKSNKYPGIVRKTDLYIIQLDPAIHQYYPIYKYDVQVNDTIISIKSRVKYDINDTIYFYYFNK